MPAARRPRSARLSALAVGAVALTVLAAPSVRAEEEGLPAGDTVVGELVQGYADPGPDPGPGLDHDAHRGSGHDPGLLSWIRTAPGEAVRVPTEDLGEVTAGATVEVTVGGEVEDEATAAGLEPALEVLASEVVTDAAAPVAPATTPVNHPVTVVMLQPADAARDGTTLADVRAMVDGPVADFWAEQTGGVVRFGTVAGFDWTTRSTLTCDNPFGLWEEAAVRAGWSGEPWEHLLVYVPANSPGCSYGLGTIGDGMGSGGLAYVQAPGLDVIAHEFGHNLGLGHSSQIQCDGVVDGGSCQVSAYYDLYDVMGISWGQVGSLSSPHAALLGVLPAGSVPTVAAGAAPEQVTLAPVGARTGTRAARLTDADGDEYWLEYRTATGRDGWLATPDNLAALQTGVLLRQATYDGFDDTSLLLDGSPSRQADWPGDLAVALPVSVPVTVGSAPFTVTVLETTASGARVEISGTAPPHPIDVAYERAGGAGGALGQPTVARFCGLRDGGCFQHFQGGSIYWSPGTAAHTVVGQIRSRYSSLRWENGRLGYPTTDEFCGLRDGGCFQHFQGGSIYWSPGTSYGHPVFGGIRDRWAAQGWENGRLGYPTADEFCGLRDGGCFQHFQGGSIYWSPGTGVHAVRGGIRDRWAAQGWENGRLGYPTADEFCGLRDGGCFQHFQGGSIYWSPGSGVQIVLGAIRDGWAMRGWESGRLGYPVSEERCGLRGGGCFQHFQGGSVYWSPASHAQVVDGAIRDRWGALGWENGRLGYPTNGARCSTGSCVQWFQGGSISWSPTRGTEVSFAW